MPDQYSYNGQEYVYEYYPYDYYEDYYYAYDDKSAAEESENKKDDNIVEVKPMGNPALEGKPPPPNYSEEIPESTEKSVSSQEEVVEEEKTEAEEEVEVPVVPMEYDHFSIEKTIKPKKNQSHSYGDIIVGIQSPSLPPSPPSSLDSSVEKIKEKVRPQLDSDLIGIEKPKVNFTDNLSNSIDDSKYPVMTYDDEEDIQNPTLVREYDASVSHLWNNMKLLPLGPDIYEDKKDKPINLTSLFKEATPLSPNITNDIGILPGIAESQRNPRYMAYVLIGACVGLAFLSITGVIVIIRFRKTCASRQLGSRTRLEKHSSLDSDSNNEDHPNIENEPGHKLGSWFTGKNEHIGSGKLRSNMALPAVQDLRRDKSSRKTGSTKDLISLSGISSPTNSQRSSKDSRNGSPVSIREEKSRPASWLHGEYRASYSDVSQTASHDPNYSAQKFVKTHNRSKSDEMTINKERSRKNHHKRRGESIRNETRYGDNHRHKEVEESYDIEGFIARNETAISTIDSEDLDRMRHHQYMTTDSEMDDHTSHYDDSKEPSRYQSDSRELDEDLSSSNNPMSFDSQELGDNLSRDLKKYQSSEIARTHKSIHIGGPDNHGQEQTSEFYRTQSQISFSRDNVQNEVFLEFDNIFRQHGQFLNQDNNGTLQSSTLGRHSIATADTNLSGSRPNSPDSIEESNIHVHHDRPPSPPVTPPRFSPPPPPPRPPKPSRENQTPSPTIHSVRTRGPSPGHPPPAPPGDNSPVHWTNDDERLI